MQAGRDMRVRVKFLRGSSGHAGLSGRGKSSQMRLALPGGQAVFAERSEEAPAQRDVQSLLKWVSVIFRAKLIFR